MRTISFKEFKNLPKRVMVLWIIALLLALTGMVFLILDIFEIKSDMLTIAMMCVVAAQIINVFGIRQYKDRLYK